MSVIRHGDEVHAYYGRWTRRASVPFDVAISHAAPCRSFDLVTQSVSVDSLAELGDEHSLGTCQHG